MSLRDEILAERRAALLLAISANDLADMRRRVTAETIWHPAGVLRRAILDDWGTYAEEIQRWVDYTVTGESRL
jgi:hypothetical protein